MKASSTRTACGRLIDSAVRNCGTGRVNTPRSRRASRRRGLETTAAKPRSYFRASSRAVAPRVSRAGERDDARPPQRWWRGRVRGQERDLVPPTRVDVGEPSRLVDQWLAVLAHSAHHRAPADPDRGRDRSDIKPVLTDPPTRLPTARLVSAERVATCSLVSVPRPPRARRLRAAPQRFSQSSVTARLADGRSRTRTWRRRACGTPHTAQPVHHAVVAVVSAACSSSPYASDTANNLTPSSPSRAVPALPSTLTWASLVTS